MEPARVPYYAQTAEFSCGAACLVMTMASLRRARPTRSLEFGLWREANMIGVPGIDKWGLTIPALRRDVKATVISPRAVTFEDLLHTGKALFTREQLELADLAQRENRRDAAAAGARWVRRVPTPADAKDALKRGRLPVLLVHLGALGGEPVPHWVVVTAMQNGDCVLHDPDPDGPGVRRLSVAKAWKAMDTSDFRAAPTMVVFGP